MKHILKKSLFVLLCAPIIFGSCRQTQLPLPSEKPPIELEFNDQEWQSVEDNILLITINLPFVHPIEFENGRVEVFMKENGVGDWQSIPDQTNQGRRPVQVDCGFIKLSSGIEVFKKMGLQFANPQKVNIKIVIYRR